MAKLKNNIATKSLKSRIEVLKRNLNNSAPGTVPYKSAQKRIKLLENRLQKIQKKSGTKSKIIDTKKEFLEKPKQSRISKLRADAEKRAAEKRKAEAKRKAAVKAPKEKPKQSRISKLRADAEKRAAEKRKVTPKAKVQDKKTKATAPSILKSAKANVIPKAATVKKVIKNVKKDKVKPNISDVLAKERDNVFAWPGSKYKEFSTKLKKPEQRVAPIPKKKPKRVAPKKIFREVVEKKGKPVKQNIDFDSDAISDQEYYGTGKSKSKPKPKRKGILDTMFSGFKTGDFTPKDQTVKNPFTGSDMELSYDYPEDPDSVESMFSYKHGGWLGKGKRKALRGHRKERRGG
jgi:hypothetical protein